MTVSSTKECRLIAPKTDVSMTACCLFTVTFRVLQNNLPVKSSLPRVRMALGYSETRPGHLKIRLQMLAIRMRYHSKKPYLPSALEFHPHSNHTIYIRLIPIFSISPSNLCFSGFSMIKIIATHAIIQVGASKKTAFRVMYYAHYSGPRNEP
jgi:hypothetical protein